MMKATGSWTDHVIIRNIDGQYHTICKCDTCKKETRSRGRPLAARWCEHLVCECEGLNESQKMTLALKSNARRVKKWREEREQCLEEERKRIRHDEDRNHNLDDDALVDEEDELCWEQSKRYRQSTLDEPQNASTFDRCDDDRKERINDAVMRFVCGCGLAFKLIDSTFFRDMIKELNEAYYRKLPKCDAFRRTYLPKLYTRTVQQVGDMWRLEGNLPRTFGFDGYTSKADGEQVINCTKTVQDKTAFVVCIDPERQSENADYLARKVMEEMEKVLSETPLRTVEEAYAGVVADNTSTNRKAFRAPGPSRKPPTTRHFMLKVMLHDSSRLPHHLFAFICYKQQALDTNTHNS